jgi:signal transduction histidine kinase
VVKVAADIPDEESLVLSTVPPGPVQERLALFVVLGLLGVFLLITVGPLSGVQTKPVAAFVPAYATALFVCDSITAILLFAQFSVLRSRAILVIASGYLFVALILIPWILAFPGVFVPARGLLGGLQSTSWLYFFQHAGLPVFAIGYVLARDADASRRVWQGTTRAAVGLSVFFTTTLVLAVAVLCTAGEPLLPKVVADSLHLSPLWPYAGAPVALLSLTALIVLWRKRRSMLDLWLIVVLWLYTIEIPLSYYPSPVRFSIGWYTVRVIGFLSSVLVLIVLLYEIETLYRKLLGAVLGVRRERVARLMTGDAVAASIAHEVRQPLTAMTTSATAGFRFLDRATPNIDRAMQAFKQIAADGHRAGEVVGSIRAMFRHDARAKTAVDINNLVLEALSLQHDDLLKHSIQLQTEPGTQLPAVLGDRTQLQQVLLNLIANAVDAMASRDGPRILRVRSDAYEGDGVIVSVADTGPGVSSQDSERIFNPLFTTKPDGMGMGLSICRAIVEAHEGRLWATPNSPQGTVFQFTLHGAGPAPG